jgi:hypothetical protein
MYQNIYNKMLRAMKKLFYDRELATNQSDLRTTWKILTEAIRKSKSARLSYSISTYKWRNYN